MELLLVFLSTAIGTIVGVAAVMVMQRKDRKSAVGAGSVLRTQLQNTEWALASAGRDVEDLRQKLEKSEQLAQFTTQELEATRKQLAECAARADEEAAGRAEADSHAAETTARSQALADRVTALESAASASEESSQSAARELEAARQQLAELAAQASHHAARCAEAETRAAQSAETAEALSARLRELETANSASEEANHRIQALEADLDRLRYRLHEDETRHAELVRELGTEREKSAALAGELAHLRSAHASLEATVLRDRELAAEGIDLLQKAQAKLTAAVYDSTDSAKPAVNGLALVG